MLFFTNLSSSTNQYFSQPFFFLITGKYKLCENRDEIWYDEKVKMDSINDDVHLLSV